MFNEIAPGIYHDPETGRICVQGPPLESPILDGKPLHLPPGEQVVEISPGVLEAAARAIQASPE